MPKSKIIDIDSALLPELRSHATIGYQFARAIENHKGNVVVDFGKQVARLIVDERQLVNRRGIDVYPMRIQLTEHKEGFAHFNIDSKTAFAFASLTSDVFLSCKLDGHQITKPVPSGKMLIGETKDKEKQSVVLYTNSGNGFKLIVIQMHPFAQIIDDFKPPSMVNVQPATEFITNSIETIWNNRANLKRPQASIIHIDAERNKEMTLEADGTLSDDKIALYTLASMVSGVPISSIEFKEPTTVNAVANRLFPTNKYYRMDADPTQTTSCLMVLLNKAFGDVSFIDGDWKEDCFSIIQGAMPLGIVIDKAMLSNKTDAVYAAIVIKFIQSFALSDSSSEDKLQGLWKHWAGTYLNSKIYNEIDARKMDFTNINLVIGCAYWHARIHCQLGPETKAVKSTAISSLFDIKAVAKKKKEQVKHESEDEKDAESVGRSSSEEDGDYEEDDFLVDESSEEDEEDEESDASHENRKRKTEKTKKIEKKQKLTEKMDTDEESEKKQPDSDEEFEKKKEKKKEQEKKKEKEKEKEKEKKKEQEKKKEKEKEREKEKKEKEKEREKKEQEKEKEIEQVDEEPEKKQVEEIEFLSVIEVDKLGKAEKKQYLEKVDQKLRNAFQSLSKKSAGNSLVSIFFPNASRVLMIKLTQPFVRSNPELTLVVACIMKMEHGYVYDFCEKEVVTELLVNRSEYIRRMTMGANTLVRVCPVTNEKSGKRPLATHVEKGMEYVFFYVGTSAAIDEMVPKVQNNLKDYVLSTTIFDLE